MILEKEYIKNVSFAHRKKYAQFFTPEPIAQIMVDWLLKTNDISSLLEPAFGLGIFTRKVLTQRNDIAITGFDIDNIIFETAKNNYQNHLNLDLHLEDYLFNDWNNKYDTIVCNPPYLKFHDYENKKTLTEIKKRLNIQLSGFTNIYTLFLLKSIYQLKDKGRIAYLIPSEFLNSDYGKYVKDYLLKSNLLRHIFIFDFRENIFDNVLTTSAILLLAKDKNYSEVSFSTITNSKELDNISKIIQNYPNITGQISLKKEEINPNIKWRVYYQKQKSKNYKNLIPFKNIAKVVRGIATGANEYFSFNQEKATKYNIDKSNLLPCIIRSKDIKNPFFTNKNFSTLKVNNADIFLFNGMKNLNNEAVISYIKLGEKREINKKYLTSKRNPWYSLENRPPSPIWVGVFNRSGLKFVRNEAGIYNLTTFHCIYPVNGLFNELNIDLLFAYLLTDVAQQLFDDNRREYGDGLKKFEPNDLNNALMLDLSKLDEILEKKIIDLFKIYRKSALENKANDNYIIEINEILIKEYKV
ncbi:MAG: N-6 DNA methylase [Thiomargarita sp.]|nr:N-6 DNA methylase [Thiomargarita sp.]